MDYFPLRVVQHIQKICEKNDSNFKWGNIYETQKSYYCNLFKMACDMDITPEDLPETEKEFVSIIMSYDILEDPRMQKYEKLKACIYAIIPYVAKAAGYSLKDFKDNPRLDIRTEIRDLLCQMLMLDRWVVDKQVLKPDPMFAYHLIQTEKLVLSKDMLDHLPMHNFYIDMSKCRNNFDIEYIFSDIDGIFVNVIKTDSEHYTVAFYIVFDKSDENKEDPYLTFSFYTFLEFNENNNYEFGVDTNIFMETEMSNIVTAMRDKFKNPNQIIPHRNLKVFVLQLLCYMSVSEPDIVPDSSMKFTYKKPNPGSIKNKFKEVYMQDVGVKIGSIITQRKKEAEESNRREANGKDNKDGNKTETHRKPPSAHYRRAHWHRYRTGKGRTNIIVKWIEPTFVCGTQSADVIVHKVI